MFPTFIILKSPCLTRLSLRNIREPLIIFAEPLQDVKSATMQNNTKFCIGRCCIFCPANACFQPVHSSILAFFKLFLPLFLQVFKIYFRISMKRGREGGGGTLVCFQEKQWKNTRTYFDQQTGWVSRIHWPKYTTSKGHFRTPLLYGNLLIPHRFSTLVLMSLIQLVRKRRRRRKEPTMENFGTDILGRIPKGTDSSKTTICKKC